MTTAQEFVDKLTRIESEIRLLGEERGRLCEEFKDKLDIKAMKAAIRIVRIRNRLGDSEGECDTYLSEIDGKEV